ncbi:MAG: hypothetical protein ABIT83_02470 [Massilia sp.]
MQLLKSMMSALCVAVSMGIGGSAARAAEPPVATQPEQATATPPAETVVPDKPQQAAQPPKSTQASPAKPPAKPSPPRRRAVQQIISSTVSPPPASPPPSYGPVLTRSAPLASPLPAPLPGSPRINSCDGGGCTDTSGARYNGGVGNAVISPQGQLCNRTGATLQCF